MIVGLPGAGIGGLFYLLLVLWMPFRELGRLLRTGRLDAGRWVFIGRMSWMVAAILAALWAEGWLLTRAVVGLAGASGAAGAGAAVRAVESFVPNVTFVPIAVLLAIVASLQIARLLLRRGGARRAAQNAA